MGETIRQIAAVLASRMPILVVLMVGLVLVYKQRSRHPGRAANFGLAGLGILTLTSLVAVFAALFDAELMGLGAGLATAGEVVGAMSRIVWVGSLAGLGLLIAALVSRIGAADPTTSVERGGLRIKE